MWVEAESPSGTALHFRADRVAAVKGPASVMMGPLSDVYLVGVAEPLCCAEDPEQLLARVREVLSAAA